jgi:hypothetical protein
MKRHIAMPIAAALTAGLLVTACSSDGDSSDDGIAGSNGGATSEPEEGESGTDPSEDPEPEPSDDGIDRPEITLPADMVNVFEDTETGDPVKDAIIADVIAGINAVDMGFAESDPAHEAIAFYAIEDARDSAAAFVQESADNGLSWAGDVVYSDFQVNNEDQRATEPIVTYCVDESRLQTKELATGTLQPNTGGADNFFARQAALRQTDQGVWQVFKLSSAGEERDAECQR